MSEKINTRLMIIRLVQKKKRWFTEKTSLKILKILARVDLAVPVVTMVTAGVVSYYSKDLLSSYRVRNPTLEQLVYQFTVQPNKLRLF